jgi:hypothetical protein
MPFRVRDIRFIRLLLFPLFSICSFAPPSPAADQKESLLDASAFYHAEEWRIASVVSKSAIEKTVDLEIRLRYVGDRYSDLGSRTPMVDYHIHILDESGKEVPLTAFGRTESTFNGFELIPKRFQSQVVVANHIDLTRCFALEEDHTYTIHVRRYLSNWLIERDTEFPTDGNVRVVFVEAPPVELVLRRE